jgi:hypothetical protein
MNTRGIIGLALFLVGTSAAFTLSARDTLADVPWQYMPESTLSASIVAYDATFIPAARGYLAVFDGVGDIQAQAYRTTGVGLAAVAGTLSQTEPIAAVARWYTDSSASVNARLAP